MVEKKIIELVSVATKKMDVSLSEDLFSDLQSSSIAFFEIIEKIEAFYEISFYYEDFSSILRSKSKRSIKVQHLVNVVKIKLEQKKDSEN